MKNHPARLRALYLAAAVAVICLAALMAMSAKPGVANAQDAFTDLVQPADNGGESEISGYLISRPDDGLGAWSVECSPSLTCTIIVTTTNALEDGIPPVGAWIEASGVVQSDGKLLAQKVRAEDHSAMELVIRLETGVVSSTFALDHDLTPLATLASQANIHLFATEVDEDAELDEISRAEGVVWVEFNYTNSIPASEGFKTWRWGGEDQSAFVNQAAFTQVHLASAQSVNRGQGVTIAVLDTGVALNHPAFSQGELLPGIDLVNNDNVPDDTGPGFGWGHGTHIAGILARMAPQAKILPVRVLDANGRGNTFALAYGIEWAVAHGADVINLSLGAEAGSRVLSETIAAALAQGVVVVAAAGNENSTVVMYPAGFPGVLGVGAVDSASARAGFSNYGTWVDIAAPGVGITSSVPFSGSVGYASWSGTSMATAFVSGAAALVRSSRGPEAQVAAVLTVTVRAGAAEVGGVLDAAAAVGVGPEPNPIPGIQTYLPLITTK